MINEILVHNEEAIVKTKEMKENNIVGHERGKNVWEMGRKKTEKQACSNEKKQIIFASHIKRKESPKQAEIINLFKNTAIFLNQENELQ